MYSRYPFKGRIVRYCLRKDALGDEAKEAREEASWSNVPTAECSLHETKLSE